MRSQSPLANEVIIAIVAVLLTITSACALQYYRLIRKARSEYEKASAIVEDVIMSFNRQLKREVTKLDRIEFEIQGNAAKIESTIKRVDNTEKKVNPVEDRLNIFLEENQKASAALFETVTKLQEIKASHENLQVKVTELQEQMQKLSVAPELKAESVIPLRRDKAIAALTDTEIQVLEMLVAEGSKTAPEIRERVQLSREHTARLMKKLYEEGYLERETDKIPFKYNVKKEMESLLKKSERAQL
jgi:DNA repair ATPase RecN